MTTEDEAKLVEELATLDAVLGYFWRRLKTADRSDPYVRGYKQAHSDVAHIRHQLWYSMTREDKELADRTYLDWDVVNAAPELGNNKIFE